MFLNYFEVWVPWEPFFQNEEIIGELLNGDDSIAKFFTKP